MAIETPSAAFATPANNGTETYTYPFEQFEDDDVFVYLLNETTGDYDVQTVTDDYTISGSTITFTEAPTTQVLILRKTDFNDLKIPNFTPGSSIRGGDLDKNFLQLLRVNQEYRDLKVDKFFPEFRAQLDMNGNKISDLGDATADDQAVNREQLGDIIALDITSDESQGIILNKTESGDNSGDEMVITARDSSATEKGVVQITAPAVTDGNPITLTRPNDGEIELTIENGSIDVQKIKGLDRAETSEYSEDWDDDDDQVATVGALAARHDVVVSDTEPTSDQVGKLWQDTTAGNRSFRVWDGTSWRLIAAGEPFVPATTTIVRYVDDTNGSDATDVTGFLPQSPLKSIKRAVDLVNEDESDGTLILVAPGVYQETLPIQIERNNVSIVGQALRSCFVQPTEATEENTMFECNSGTLIANMTLVGLKASGTRGSSTYDDDDTYGLPENQGWCAAFYDNCTIKKSPYIQNCTSFNDSSIDNSVKYDQTNLPGGGLGGDTTSAMSGGGILCDGSVPASDSPLRSFVVDSFTQINLDGPGILCTNNGYAQLVSFFGTFCHYHAKALNGGQLNLSNCTTDFGRYGLIADGKSVTTNISGNSVGATDAGSTTITVDGLTAQNGFLTNQPGTTMVMEIGDDLYQILETTEVSSDQCEITVYRATSTAPETNIGLAAAVADNTLVEFYLRSYISTGGHVFEYAGAGTDYSAHPDYGGRAEPDNQIVELGGSGSTDDQVYNRGKVWQSSTDENGLFKVGPNFTVDQRRNIVQVENLTPAAQVVSDLTPQLGGDLDLNSNDIDGTGNIDITGTVTATSFTGDITGTLDIDITGDVDITGSLTTSENATIGTLTFGSPGDGITTNVAAGRDALASVTTGANNVGVGRNALNANTTGEANIAVGRDALDANTTGGYNTVVGYSAMCTSTTANNSCAYGYFALKDNTSGADNMAFGLSALRSNTTGDNNSAFGYNALRNSTTADYNTAIGYQSSYENTTGEKNTALGSFAGYNNETGQQNASVGYEALYHASSNYNTAIGAKSLLANTSGERNTAVGNNAFASNLTGTRNTGIGEKAGFYIEGSNNTVLGAYEGTASDSTLSDTVIISAGQTERARCDSDGNWSFLGTESVVLPVGTEAQRPGTPAAGMIRFNDDSDKFEGYDGTEWADLVVGNEIGTGPDNVPLNQFLGQQAFVDEVGTVRPSASDPQADRDINFEYVSDTSIKIRMRGDDGTVRSTTLTLS